MAKKLKKKQIKYNIAPAVSAVKQNVVAAVAQTTSTQAQPDEKYKLPIAEIKMDLLKNIGYTAFAIIAVMTLKYTGFGLNLVQKFVKF